MQFKKMHFKVSHTTYRHGGKNILVEADHDLDERLEHNRGHRTDVRDDGAAELRDREVVSLPGREEHHDVADDVRAQPQLFPAE